MINKSFEPSDYCPTDIEPAEALSDFERLTLTGGGRLVKAKARAAQVFGSFTFPESIGDINPEKILAAATYYDNLCDPKNPNHYFALPQTKPAVNERIIHHLPDGAVLDISFQSSFCSKHPEFKSAKANELVHARVWRHHSGSTGTVVAIHGWEMNDHRVNSLIFLPGMLYRSGLDVVLFELPYHGRRAPKETHTEPLFPSADIVRTNEGLAQTISDLRELRLYLEASGSQKIGVMGMSLGGYVTALWASLDKLEFGVPIVPFGSMGEVAWEFLSRRPDFQNLVSSGLDPEVLQRAYSIHSPLTYAPAVDPDRIMIVAGINDTLIPPRQPNLLCRHFRYPSMHWFTGGHVAQLRRESAFEKVLGFLDSLGLVKSSTAE